MGILSDFLRTLSRTKNGQNLCFACCFPHENFRKLTGMNHDKVTGARNQGQGHRVIVRVRKVC